MYFATNNFSIVSQPIHERFTSNSGCIQIQVSDPSPNPDFGPVHELRVLIATVNIRRSAPRGGSRISGNGVMCIKVWGFALLILSHFP